MKDFTMFEICEYTEIETTIYVLGGIRSAHPNTLHTNKNHD